MPAQDTSQLDSAIDAHLASGDRDGAVTEALRGYGPGLLGYLCAVLHEDQLAGEVYATVCEKLWRGVASFRSGTSFRAWIYRVAWNAAHDELRRGQREARRRGETDALAEVPAAAPRSTTALHARTSVRERVGELRRRLTAEEQTLLTLRVDRGLSFAEIALVFGAGIDEPALRKRFERVKRKLRELAEDAGLLARRP